MDVWVAFVTVSSVTIGQNSCLRRKKRNVLVNMIISECLFFPLEQKCLSLWRYEDVQTERETRDQSDGHQ